MSMISAFFATTAKATADEGGSGGTLILDLFGTDILAAYSLRKLSSTYSGDAVRVRRTSDNAEQDIGFDGSDNLVQTTSGKQIRIATAGTIETKNSLPTTQGANNLHLTISGVPTTSQPITGFEVMAHHHASNAGTKGTWVSKVNTGNFIRFDVKRFVRMGILSKFSGTQINAQGATAHGDTDLHVVTRMMNGASSVVRVDQVAEGRSGGGDWVVTGAQMGSITTIGTNSTSAYNGQLSELLIYAADKTSDFTNIENNLKTYYSTP